MTALADIIARPKRHKYGAVATELDGHRFPSKAEMRRYAQLKLLERAGAIRDLQLHPRFPLVVNGVPCGKYIADFGYYDNRADKAVVEDCKSPPTRTAVYRLKKRLVEALYAPLTITEVA